MGSARSVSMQCEGNSGSPPEELDHSHGSDRRSRSARYDALVHSITAIITAHPCDAELARRLDLVPVPLAPPLTLFNIDHYYTAYWQATRGCAELLDVPATFPATFPREAIVSQLVAELTGHPLPRFAVIQTEYWGGIGDQWAIAVTGTHCDSHPDASINDVLRVLGVARRGSLDEFDTVGLGAHRYPSTHLERYVALCEELSV
jgi:hypothetical protein